MVENIRNVEKMKIYFGVDALSECVCISCDAAKLIGSTLMTPANEFSMAKVFEIVARFSQREK